MIKSITVKLSGYLLVAATLYFLICISLYITAVILLHENNPRSTWPLREFQRNYYFDGARHIWQYKPSCVEVDKRLVYKPREGECDFSNFEFSTKLNFDSHGRIVPSRGRADNTLKGIAVLGDSQAMGWGVNDADTLANALQQNTRKPVFNLAVSSYATDREIVRLLASGLIKKIDTVIIQYCDNDLRENQNQISMEGYLEQSKQFSVNLNREVSVSKYSNFRYLLRKVKFSVSEPIRRVQDLISSFSNETQIEDFRPHRIALVNILRRYKPVLQDKNVFVFYSNGHGKRFANFPVGRDAELPFVEFAQPELTSRHFFLIDDHLNREGHLYLGKWLSEKLMKINR